MTVPDPAFNALSTALFWLDYAAVALFGASGAIAAARGRQDIITFIFFAAITGVGGGTLRDLLIGAPVFWVQRPDYILICALTGLAVWGLAPRNPSPRPDGKPGKRMTALLWLDAMGMAAYAVVGAAKALNLGVAPLSAVVMGVLTASFGGIIRDVLAGEPNLLLRREIYITAALLGAGVFVALSLIGLSFWPAGLSGFAAALVLRGAAIHWSLGLPAFGVRDHEDGNKSS
ncbi:trimeric intracellular cation channel family protein [Asticcacaulis sp. AND118]|uniref:trimeric intracellular cation channel family protein n=1 Tax=Asticcacaulis sp. AND118 TaxID=2840468 RepID=UPI001CFFD63F|nr:trimeric intracellular cation channel family protein [Asticcacaulis sp. AND118]UDF04417.1 trimeric intracellular cation channel family protein [Asticcacaulis sp. AND118]